MLEPTPKLDKKGISKALKLLTAKGGMDLVKNINSKYQYWDKVKHQEIPNNIKHEDLWFALKVIRNAESINLKFGNYKFSFCNTDSIQKAVHEFDLNIGGSLSSDNLIPAEDKNKYLISSIMEEAIASSFIEGAVSTRKKAKEMLRKNSRPRNKSDQMILNNYEGIKYILKNKDKELTPELLLKVHKILTNNTLNEKEYEGNFRNNNDICVYNVVESCEVYDPPSHEEIPELIKDLCDFFNNDTEKSFIHPINKGIILHFLIGFIHPFADGNGRTGRGLFYWYLLSKDYWMTEYLSISKFILKSKTQYEKAYLYCECDDNDLTYFINYHQKAMKVAFDTLKLYIQRKIREKKQLLNFQRIPNINERQSQIIKLFLDKHSISLTVKEIEARYGVANQTARSDLIGLEKLGYLEQIKLNKIKQSFVKSSKFDSLLENIIK
jgi:Fic family protein